LEIEGCAVFTFYRIFYIEEGGQETVHRGSANFFYLAPLTFKFAHPEYGVLGGQKRIVAHPNHKT